MLENSSGKYKEHEAIHLIDYWNATIGGVEQSSLLTSVLCFWRQGRKITTMFNWNYSSKILERQKVIIQTEIYLPSNANITKGYVKNQNTVLLMRGYLSPASTAFFKEKALLAWLAEIAPFITEAQLWHRFLLYEIVLVWWCLPLTYCFAFFFSFPPPPFFFSGHDLASSWSIFKNFL